VIERADSGKQNASTRTEKDQQAELKNLVKSKLCGLPSIRVVGLERKFISILQRLPK